MTGTLNDVTVTSVTCSHRRLRRNYPIRRVTPSFPPAFLGATGLITKHETCRIDFRTVSH